LVNNHFSGGSTAYQLRLFPTIRTERPSSALTFINSTFSSTPYAVNTWIDNLNLKFINCNFKSTTSDFANIFSGNNYIYVRTYRIFLDSCNSTSPSLFTRSAFANNKHSYIKTKNLNGATGSFKTFTEYGNVESDSTISRLGKSSIKGSPNTQLQYGINIMTATASYVYLEVSRKVVPVLKNTYVNVSVWVRKSKTSDGANYNGLQPRLVVGVNSYLGVTYDTVLATATSQNGVFEKITATFSSPNDGVAEFWVDCNGTTGWINVDDWSITIV
jgi:hypothetical protein